MSMLEEVTQQRMQQQISSYQTQLEDNLKQMTGLQSQLDTKSIDLEKAGSSFQKF